MEFIVNNCICLFLLHSAGMFACVSLTFLALILLTFHLPLLIDLLFPIDLLFSY